MAALDREKMASAPQQGAVPVRMAASNLVIRFGCDGSSGSGVPLVVLALALKLRCSRGLRAA